jgi:hypothetical protein
MPKRAAPETLTADGAAELAARITDYWRREGHAVRVRIERISLASAARDRLHETGMYAVRSDLLAGLPAAGRGERP